MGTATIQNLNPGWVLITASGMWHHRDAAGVVACQKARGAQLAVAAWNSEPSGANEVCPACRRILQAREIEERRAAKEAAPATPPEPEVLTVPDELKPRPPATRTKLAEAVRLVAADFPAVSYGVVWRWCASDPALGYDPRTKTVPDAALDRMLDKAKAFKPRTSAAKASAAPAQAAPVKAEQVIAVRLLSRYRALAGVLGMTGPEFVEWALRSTADAVVADIRRAAAARGGQPQA